MRRKDHCVVAPLCTHYIDDLLPHAPLALCSYWGQGQEFHNWDTVLKINAKYASLSSIS
jgi:hypothetical protein